MGRFINLIGKKFGKLAVIKYINKDKWGSSRWLCKCSCGNEKIIIGHSLTSGNTKSCGCEGGSFKHGYYRRGRTNKTYKSWDNMIQRCYYSNNQAYKYYGARGIKVCSRWLPENNGYNNFLADMGEKPKNKTLDKIDNNKDYSPKNCRWATYKEQTRNQRNNHVLKMGRISACYAEWEEITGIPQGVIGTRIKRGWSIKRALTTPLGKYKKENNRG